jgi:hypothetical protein
MKQIYLKSSFLILASAAILSCGKDDKAPGEGGSQEQLQLSTSEQIMAEWSGVYNALSAGEPVSETFAAKASFTADYQFEISLENNPSAKVVGTWNEFQGKTLILKISGSTISAVGSAGKIVETDLDLTGAALRIRNKNFDLRLSKKTTSIPSGDPVAGRHFFSGSWLCDNGAGRRTKISIDDDNNFKLSSVRATERAFVATGDLSEVAEARAVLSVSSSSDPLADGSYFELTKDGSNAQLMLSSPNSPPLRLGKCFR